MLLLISLLLQATQATVLIFWTDSNGDTHCEVRHDLDDCGFANVNPSVDCFPWFSMTGSGNNGPVIVNNAIIEPTFYDEEYLYDDIPPPKTKDVVYDSYLVRESCLLRGGTKVEISQIQKTSDTAALVRFASAGCDSKYRVISVPAPSVKTKVPAPASPERIKASPGGIKPSSSENMEVSTSSEEMKGRIFFNGDVTLDVETTEIKQQYGEILIDGVVFEIE